LKRCDREIEEMDRQMKTWAEAVSSMESETIVIDRTCDKMQPGIDTLQLAATLSCSVIIFIYSIYFKNYNFCS